MNASWLYHSTKTHHASIQRASIIYKVVSQVKTLKWKKSSRIICKVLKAPRKYGKFNCKFFSIKYHTSIVTHVYMLAIRTKYKEHVNFYAAGLIAVGNIWYADNRTATLENGNWKFPISTLFQVITWENDKSINNWDQTWARCKMPGEERYFGNN